MRKNMVLSYALAMFVIFIWSVTFVSTKILLKYLSPTEILFYRYVIAYFLFVAASPKMIWPLSFSTASNVSLLVATAPMLTGLVSHFLTKNEKITTYFIYGGLLALAGVFLIVFNGHFVLRLNPAGDMLAIMAALSFAFYSIIIRDLNRGVYSAVVITRKTFFYSLLSLIPLLFTPLFEWDPRVLMKKEVFGNLIFLGVFASALCFLLWNRVIWDLGAVKANSLIYLSPPLAMLSAAIVLHERITLFAGGGGLLILLGVYLSQKKAPGPKKDPEHLKPSQNI